METLRNMSEGTSLEDIEDGNIQNEADNARMNAILTDMNGAGLVEESIPEQREMLPMQPQPMYQAPLQPQQPTYYPQQPPMLPQYPMGGAGGMPPGMYGGGMSGGMHGGMQGPPRYAVEEEDAPAPRRKTNAWSTMFERLRDPIMVSVLVCLISLPAIHTFASKHATWAYKVGGTLSWKGMLLQSVLVAAIYALYKYGLEVLDM